MWLQIVVFEMGGRGWTELAKETPGGCLRLAPTLATLSNLATFCDYTPAEGFATLSLRRFWQPPTKSSTNSQRVATLSA